jgi:hypothetical protein
MTEQTEVKTTYARPGAVTFAAIMMFLLGGIYLVTAIEGFSNAAWLRDVSFGLFGQQFIIWAVVDTIVGLLLLFAGYSILQGGSFGRWVGIIVATIGAIKWFFLVFWVPIAALIVITISVIIIYALVSRSEYFNQ